MKERPSIWHYGLMAERWADSIHEAPQLPFLLAAVERFGQPALDLACGTGRLLLPMLQAGIDVDGCDLSPDMLDHCRRRADALGLQPNLLQQSMSEFDAKRPYRTIFICDSFGLGADRAADRRSLDRCHANLAAGGALIVNIQAEYTSPEAWMAWTSRTAGDIPEGWPDSPSVRVGPEGIEHHAYFRTLEVDPLEQRYVREVRLEKWAGGKMVATENRRLEGNMYLKNELMLMLAVAGFDPIELNGDYTDEPATSASEELVFTAIKPLARSA